MGKIQDWRQASVTAFFRRGEVRSQGIGQFNASIVQDTKQIVGHQIYRHLEDVKVIGKRKQQKKAHGNKC